MFETVQATAPDPILALMMAFREDQRADKIDLGVGVYKDASGKTPVMQAIKLAEQKLHNDQDTKTYVSPTGDCLLYTSPSPRDATLSRMPSSA